MSDQLEDGHRCMAVSSDNNGNNGDNNLQNSGLTPSKVEQHSYEQIDHVHSLANDFSNLYLDNRFSDVVLKVNGERIHAHRMILASRSNYFRALLCGGFKESHQSEVEISGVSLNSFKILLEYIYCGRMNLNTLKDEVVIEVFNLSNLYGFTNLELSLSKYLQSSINVHNVCNRFVAARLYPCKEFVLEVLNFIDNHAVQVLNSEGFLSLLQEELFEILKRDSLYANELDIFMAVCNWIKVHQDNENPEFRSKVFSVVRFPLMTLAELLVHVRLSKIVSSDDILDAIQVKNFAPSYILPFRGHLRPNINIAHPSHGAQIIQVEFSSDLFESELNAFVQHPDSRKPRVTGADGDIVIKLDHLSIINYIKIQLWDKYQMSYSYYIEMSVDEREWRRSVDYSVHHCRSTQRLWIDPQVVQYIRIVCTGNTANKCFHFTSMEVMYNTEGNDLIDINYGFVTPKFNVATTSMNAIVISGFRNSLLDGSFINYNLNSGFTSHRIKSGCIIVQLGQPYLLNSMRMLLWDLDDRYYSYYVEVSVNMRDWELVIDKSKKLVQSWQLIKFYPRPVVFIRITGTYCSANKSFYCVYLEAPAQDLSDPEATEVEQEVPI